MGPIHAAMEDMDAFASEAMGIFLNVSIKGTLPCPEIYAIDILDACSQVRGPRWQDGLLKLTPNS